MQIFERQTKRQILTARAGCCISWLGVFENWREIERQITSCVHCGVYRVSADRCRVRIDVGL